MQRLTQDHIYAKRSENFGLFRVEECICFRFTRSTMAQKSPTLFSAHQHWTLSPITIKLRQPLPYTTRQGDWVLDSRTLAYMEFSTKRDHPLDLKQKDPKSKWLIAVWALAGRISWSPFIFYSSFESMMPCRLYRDPRHIMTTQVGTPLS